MKVRTRVGTVVLGTMIALGGVAPAVAARPGSVHPASTQRVDNYQLNAYGTSLHEPDQAASETASATISCTNTPGLQKAASSNAPDLGDFGTVGAITSSVSTAESSGDQQGQSAATINNLDLVNGDITADSVTSTATVTDNGASRTPIHTVVFTNLKILGNPWPNTVPSNTGFILPLAYQRYAYVTLNSSGKPNGAVDKASTTIYGAAIMMVVLNQDHADALLADGVRELGVKARTATATLPLGSTVYLGRASSEMVAAVPVYASGQSAVAYVSASSSTVAKGFRSYTPSLCLQGYATSSSNDSIGDLFTTTQAYADATTLMLNPPQVWLYADEDISDFSIFNGAITGARIEEEQTGTTSNATGPVTYDNETYLLGLTINGNPVSGRTPNTQIHVPGLGEVTVNYVLDTASGRYASALHIITDSVVDGLPVGTKILIGYSHIGFTPAP